MDSTTAIKWDPFANKYFENPYPHFHELRQYSPVQHVFGDNYFFFRYEDINSILKNKDFDVHSLSTYLGEKEAYIFQSEESACPFLSKATQLWPMYLNGEIHKEIRKAITKAFNVLPYVEMIREAMDRTNAEHMGRTTFNLSDYCGEFICHFVKSAFSLGEEVTYQELKKFSNLLARSQDLYTPKQLFIELNRELLLRNQMFDHSPFKTKLEKELKHLNLDSTQLNSILLISFMAAFETSKDSISLALIEIIKEPELIEFTLLADEKSLNCMVEEVLRFSSPLQYTIRINKQPLVYDDLTIPANSKLYLCLASANRDETVFEEPNRFKPTREYNPHLSFGAGTHFCLGANIGRLELKLCLKDMVGFLQDFTIEKVSFARQIFMRTADEIKMVPK